MRSPQYPEENALRRGPHRVALFAAVFTWPLIFVGGLVTTYRVGMAVPDWPTTFGMNMFLYRFWEGAWGVFIEHGHRLYGAAVGAATIVLAVWFLAAERRRWLQALGVLALLAVIGQGILGGYRVRWNSTTLAAVHGCTAQAFFALMVALCVLTGRDWSAGTKEQAEDQFPVPRGGCLGSQPEGQAPSGRAAADVWGLRPDKSGLDPRHPAPGSGFKSGSHSRPIPAAKLLPDHAHLRRRAAVTLGLVYLQVVAGAWLRHYGTPAALLVHALLATAVWGHAGALAWRVERLRTEVPWLLASGRALAALVTVQVALGVAAWWLLRPFDGLARYVTTPQALIRTAHQANAALLLAASVVLTLRALRHLGPDQPVSLVHDREEVLA